MPNTAISLLLPVASLVLIFFTVRAMRREKPLSPVRPLISAGIVLVVTAIYMVITQARLNLLLAAGLTVLGLLLGLVEGRATKIYFKSNQLVAKQTGRYIVVWGIAYLITLGLGQMRVAALHSAGVLVMLFGLGIGVASAVTLFLRASSAKPQPVAGFAGPGQAAMPMYPPPQQGQATIPMYPPPQQADGAPYPPYPAAQGNAPVPTAPMGMVCGNCGNANQPGKRFCTRCGRPLYA